MKRLMWLMIGIVLVSCSKDEPLPKSTFAIRGKAITGLDKGYRIDMGTYMLGDEEVTETVFLITDATFTLSDGEIVSYLAGPQRLHLWIHVYNSGAAFEPAEYALLDACTSTSQGFGVFVTLNDFFKRYFSSKSGTVLIENNGSSILFSFRGTMYNWMKYSANGYQCSDYKMSKIQGNIESPPFTPISKEAWEAWNSEE
jgi:hypothetical protein